MSVLIFGDSFIGPFSLLDVKKHNNQIKLFKFKAATLKGITKEGHPNRKKIKKIIKKYRNARCVIFNFGQVDINNSHYYDRYVLKKKSKINKTLEKYVDFISNLKCGKKCKKYIIGVYPFTIKNENVLGSLYNYGVFPDEYDVVTDKNDFDRFVSERENRRLKYNAKLKEESNKNNIKYISFDEALMKDGVLEDKYIVADRIHNIHLVWETLIPVLVKKFVNCGMKEEYNEDLDKSHNDYRKKLKEENKIK